MLATVLCLIFFDCTALVVFVMAVASVCMVVSMIFRFRLADTIIAVCIGIVLSCLLLLNAQYRHDLTISLCKEKTSVEATVKEKPCFSKESERFYAVASLKSIDGEKAYGKIRLSFSETKDGIMPSSLEIGDKISFNGYVYKIGSGTEEIHNSFKAEKIYLGAYSIKNLTVSKPALRPLNYYAAEIRDKMVDTFSYHFSDKISGLLAAVLTGDKSQCPDEVYLSFKKSGVAHIMAVSGLHLSIWITVLFFCFRHSLRFRKLQYLLAVPVVVFFVFIADFSPSVSRTALMTLLFLAGSMINKSADSLNSLGFAIICILCVNPYAVYSISFQLSFACVFAIILMALPLCERAEKLVRKHIKTDILKRISAYVSSSVIISLSVAFVTFPVCAYHFGYISLMSAIANLLLIPACAPLMICAVIFLALCNLPYVSRLAYIATDMLGKYMLFVTESLSETPFATVCTDSREKSLWIFALIMLVFLFLLRRMNRRFYLRLTSAFLAFLTVFAFLNMIDKRIDECKIKVINTEGDFACALIYNGKGVLLGTNNDYYFTDTLAEVLEAENAELIAVLPEEGQDERRLEYLCSDFGTANVISENEGIELFGKVYIENRKNSVLISAYEKSVAVFYSDYLQDDISYDIIIKHDGTVISEDGKTYYAHKKGHNTTVYINDSDSIKVRRESPWLSLTKKS